MRTQHPYRYNPERERDSYNNRTSYNGYDYDEQHMRNLNRDHNYFSSHYDEPRDYRGDDRGYYERDRQRDWQDNWREDQRVHDNRRGSDDYTNDFDRHGYPRMNRENPYPDRNNVPRINETPWAIDRWAEKLERGFERWVNKDYRRHTPDSDFSW